VNPPVLKVRKVLNTSITQGTYLAFKGGTVDTLNNSVTVSGITHFSHWTFGQVGRKDDGTGGESYDIDTESSQKTSSSFVATVSLEYNPAQLDVPEQSLGLLKTANAIIVKNVLDKDLNIATTNDQTSKEWGLKVTPGTNGFVSDSLITLDDIGTGTFTVQESDSVAPFVHVGKIVDGVATASDTAMSEIVTFSGSEGTLKTIIFVNAIKDTTKFRTFSSSFANYDGKPAKLSLKKDKKTTPVSYNVVVSGTLDLRTAVEYIFTKTKGTELKFGVSSSDKNFVKTHGWLLFKKAKDLGKFLIPQHTGVVFLSFLLSFLC